MMVQAVIFGIFGLISCFLLEKISIYITKKKCRDHEIDIDKEKLKQKYKFALYVLNTTLWTFAGFQAANPFIAVLTAILFSLAIMTGIIDVRIHIIPNEFVAAMLIIGVAMQIFYFDTKNLLTSLACMFGLGALFLIVGKMLGMQKIGAGDVKLAAAMGFVLGYPDILTAVLVMSASVLVFCFIGFARFRLSMKTMLPYAPFLMIGMAFSLILNIAST
jgi:Flp pilus assembly protein protease CpaA